MSFYTVRIIRQEFLPVCLSSCPGKRVCHLIMMTKRNRQCVGRIKILGLQSDIQRLLNHHCHLFLRCRAITADGDFRLSWCVFGNRYASHHRRSQCCALCSSEFKDYLRILAIERRLDGKAVGLMFFYKFSDPREYIRQFLGSIFHQLLRGSFVDEG